VRIPPHTPKGVLLGRPVRYLCNHQRFRRVLLTDGLGRSQCVQVVLALLATKMAQCNGILPKGATIEFSRCNRDCGPADDLRSWADSTPMFRFVDWADSWPIVLARAESNAERTGVATLGRSGTCTGGRWWRRGKRCSRPGTMANRLLGFPGSFEVVLAGRMRFKIFLDRVALRERNRAPERGTRNGSGARASCAIASCALVSRSFPRRVHTWERSRRGTDRVYVRERLFARAGTCAIGAKKRSRWKRARDDGNAPDALAQGFPCARTVQGAQEPRARLWSARRTRNGSRSIARRVHPLAGSKRSHVHVRAGDDREHQRAGAHPRPERARHRARRHARWRAISRALSRELEMAHARPRLRRSWVPQPGQRAYRARVQARKGRVNREGRFTLRASIQRARPPNLARPGVLRNEPGGHPTL